MKTIKGRSSRLGRKSSRVFFAPIRQAFGAYLYNLQKAGQIAAYFSKQDSRDILRFEILPTSVEIPFCISLNAYGLHFSEVGANIVVCLERYETVFDALPLLCTLVENHIRGFAVQQAMFATVKKNIPFSHGKKNQYGSIIAVKKAGLEEEVRHIDMVFTYQLPLSTRTFEFGVDCKSSQIAQEIFKNHHPKLLSLWFKREYTDPAHAYLFMSKLVEMGHAYYHYKKYGTDTHLQYFHQ